MDEASKRGITWLKEEAHRRALMRVTNDVRHWHLLHSSVHGERDMALTLLETEQDFKDTGETQNICLGDTCYFESVADHGHVFYAMRELKYIDGIPWFGMSRLVIEIAPSTRRNKRGELLVNPSGWRVVDIKGRRNMNRAQWRNWLPDVDRVLAKPELGCATRYAVTPDLFTEED